MTSASHSEQEIVVPIINIQRRQTEVGRIRIGESVDTGKKTKAGQPIRRPVKLDKLRFTSPSQTLIGQVAALYGGTPARWEPQGGGAAVWEAYTDARAIPVVVPPNSVSQWYEAWNAGLCVRRCDGQRELLKDTPCVCPADPADRGRDDCKPTTRINLMLADVPGIGVWRLETHGFYAATELPAVAELLASAGGFVAARLEIEQRTAKRSKQGGGVETRHWMVPVLHVDAAPSTLLAGPSNGGGAPAITTVGPAVAGADERPALGQAPQRPVDRLTVEQVLELAGRCVNVAQLQQLWRGASTDGVLTDEVKTRLTELSGALTAPALPSTSAVSHDGPEPDVDEVWNRIVSTAPDGWGMSGLQDRVAQFLGGKTAEEADGFELAAFLDAMKNGQVPA
jgi:hypothetical protein